MLGLLAAPVVARALLSFLPDGRDRCAARGSTACLCFALLVSVVTGVLCGLAPALQAGRVRCRRDHGASAGRRRAAACGFRKALVVAQLAFTLVLLTVAGLFVQTLTRLYAKRPGFDSEPAR